MEKLTNIEQLKVNKHFIEINGDKITCYEFLCIHPHNKNYILALESLSQEGKKLYIPNLLEQTSYRQVFVGKYDSKSIAEKMIDYYKNRIELWTKILQG